MTADTSLYSTAAQVIPVIFVLLVVEMRIISTRLVIARDSEDTDKPEWGLQMISPMLVLALLVLGEFAAIRGLIEAPTAELRTAIGASMFGGGLMALIAGLNLVWTELSTTRAGLLSDAIVVASVGLYLSS